MCSAALGLLVASLFINSSSPAVSPLLFFILQFHSLSFSLPFAMFPKLASLHEDSGWTVMANSDLTAYSLFGVFALLFAVIEVCYVSWLGFMTFRTMVSFAHPILSPLSVLTCPSYLFSTLCNTHIYLYLYLVNLSCALSRKEYAKWVPRLIQTSC